MTDDVLCGIDIYGADRNHSAVRVDLLSDGRVRVARQLADSPTEIEPGAIYADAKSFAGMAALWPELLKVASKKAAA